MSKSVRQIAVGAFTLARCLGSPPARPEKTCGLEALGLEHKRCSTCWRSPWTRPTTCRRVLWRRLGGKHWAHLVRQPARWRSRKKRGKRPRNPPEPRSPHPFRANQRPASGGRVLFPAAYVRGIHSADAKADAAFALKRSRRPDAAHKRDPRRPERAPVAYHWQKWFALVESFGHWTVHGRKRALDTLTQIIRLSHSGRAEVR